MKKISSIVLTILMAFMFMIPMTYAADKEKVKVYIFEAGGCPYCDAEVEYLEGLASYGEKFEIIRKQLYVDHNTWEKGADFELGSKAAELFYNAGFADASASGTPFVVISDLYAAATYSTKLESIIDEAYEKGDIDVIGCLANGGDECLPERPTDGSEIVATVITIVCILGLVVLIVTTRIQSKYDAEYDNEYHYVENEAVNDNVKKELENDFVDSNFEKNKKDDDFVEVRKKPTNKTRKKTNSRKMK